MFHRVWNMRKDHLEKSNEEGMIVVETVISFTVFVVVILAVINIASILIMHNKVQFALNTTAKQISSYSYCYQLLGIRNAAKKIQEDGKPYTDKWDDAAENTVNAITDILALPDKLKTAITMPDMSNPFEFGEIFESKRDEIKALWGDAGEAVDDTKKSIDSIKNVITNPKDSFIGLIFLGLSGAKYWATKELSEQIVSLLFADNFGNTDKLVNLSYEGSSLFNDDKENLIDLWVSYDYDLGFLSLIIPQNDKSFRVVQRVTITGWLDGDGNYVSDYLSEEEEEE